MKYLFLRVLIPDGAGVWRKLVCFIFPGSRCRLLTFSCFLSRKISTFLSQQSVFVHPLSSRLFFFRGRVCGEVTSSDLVCLARLSSTPICQSLLSFSPACSNPYIPVPLHSTVCVWRRAASVLQRTQGGAGRVSDLFLHMPDVTGVLPSQNSLYVFSRQSVFVQEGQSLADFSPSERMSVRLVVPFEFPSYLDGCTSLGWVCCLFSSGTFCLFC